MRADGKLRIPFLVLLVANSVLAVGPIGVAWAPTQVHSPILIQSNADFTATNGVVSGNGSVANPYLIQGWVVIVNTLQTGISISNTNAFFTIQNVTVEAAAGAQSTRSISISSASNGLLTGDRILNCTWGIEFGSSNHISVSNSSITNTLLEGIGILPQSSWLNITNNSIVKSAPGIQVSNASHLVIANNTIASTNGPGIDISYPFGSTFLTIAKNNFTQSSGILLKGVMLSEYDSHTISQDNIVNGMPVYYYKDCSNLILNNVPIGQLLVVNCKNTSLSNLRIGGVASGLEMAYDNGVVIRNTDLSNNSYGLYLTSSTNVTVASSTFSNDQTGLQIDNTTMAKLNTNTFLDDGVILTGALLQDYDTHTITSDNLVNGKPIDYLHDTSNNLLSSTPVGQIILANTVNTTLSNLQISGTETAVLAAFVDRAQMIRNNLTNNQVGISIITSTNVNITSNSLSYDNQGITLTGYSSILNSTIPDGILVANNSLTNIKNYAITVGASHNATVTGNTVTNSQFGLVIQLAYGTLVTNNTFLQNAGAVDLSWTNHCRIYHNRFILNAFPAHEISPVPSTWDNGYPSGGNFWSDYFGPDLFHGPYQNITGPDGIGDVPYNITASTRDRYPVAPQYILNISQPTLGGSTSLTGNISYPFGWTITVSEHPYSQYVFDHWQLDGSSAGTSTTISIAAVAPSSKHYLTAFFDFVPGGLWPVTSTLTASSIAQTTLVLTWTSASGAIASYRIYNGGTLISTVSGQTTSYSVNGLTPGSYYTFKVEACDSSNNCSINGPTTSATTTTIPNQPSNQPTFTPGFILLVIVIGESLVAAFVAVLFAKSRTKKHRETESHPENPD